MEGPVSYFNNTFPFNPPFREEDWTKLQKEGDFLLKELKLIAYNGKEYNIIHLFGGLNIYEDIFNNTMSGNVLIKDANDLPHNMPMIGQEKLKIVFTRPEVADDDPENLIDDSVYEFRIYKISDRQRFHDKLQAYVLHFVSEEFIKNTYTKISLPLEKMPYSKMVETVFSKISSKPIEVEPTQHEHDYYVPMLEPFKLINALASRSISAEGNGGGYVFFESKDKFHFKSIGGMFERSPMETYYYQWFNVNPVTESGDSKSLTQKSLVQFEHFGHARGFDILNGMTQGLFSSKLCTFDPVRALYDEVEFDYASQFGEFKHLGGKLPHTPDFDCFGKPESVISLMLTNKDHDVVDWIASKDKMQPTRVEDFSLHWFSMLQQLRNNRIRATVAGDPRRQVGDIIDFALPQSIGNISKDKLEELDNYLKGKYLVVSLAHRIAPNRYSMHMELAKDSFMSDIEHIDPNTLFDQAVQKS